MKSGKRLGDSEERLDLPSMKKRRTHLRGGNKKKGWSKLQKSSRDVSRDTFRLREGGIASASCLTEHIGFKKGNGGTNVDSLTCITKTAKLESTAGNTNVQHILNEAHSSYGCMSTICPR